LAVCVVSRLKLVARRACYILVVQNPRVIPFFVKFFDILQLPVYTCFPNCYSAEILGLVHEVLRSISAEKVYEIEAATYDRYDFHSKSQNVARVPVITRFSLAALKEANRYVLDVKELL
jgi:hypothetical protein